MPRGVWWFYLVAPPLILFLVKERAFELTPFELLCGYAVTAVSTNVLGGALHASMVFVVPRVDPGRNGERRLAAYGLAFVIALLVGLPLALAALWLIEPFTGHPPAFGRLVYMAVVLGGLLVTLLAGYNRLQERAREIAETEQLARQASLQAQLAALHSRINPHFLFNALNSVAALIHEDPALAEQAVERLAGLFRYALESSRRQTVPLRDEVEAARDYLGVEALRFGERLRFTIDVEPALELVQVPPLCLLPLVENAVLHGAAQQREGGEVVLRARADGDRMVLTVDDNGPGLGRSTHRGSGTGVADLKARVSLLYGPDSLTARGRPGGGHRVTLNLARGGPLGEAA